MFLTISRHSLKLIRTRLRETVRDSNLQRNFVQHKEGNCLLKSYSKTAFCNLRTLWSFSSSRAIVDLSLQNQGKVSSSALLPVDRLGGDLITRGKKTKRREPVKSVGEESTDDESDEEWEEEEDGLEHKNLKARVPSLRLDAILKAGLKMSRSKVETAFYSSKIRVNEKKIMKKSKVLSVGDEVDVIRGSPSDNPDMIYVGRVVILKVGEYDEDKEKFPVLLRCYNNFLIRKYGSMDSDSD